jgi:hypothetical protein
MLQKCLIKIKGYALIDTSTFCVSNSLPIRVTNLCVERLIRWYCQYRLRIGLFVSSIASIEHTFMLVNGFVEYMLDILLF